MFTPAKDEALCLPVSEKTFPPIERKIDRQSYNQTSSSESVDNDEAINIPSTLQLSAAFSSYWPKQIVV